MSASVCCGFKPARRKQNHKCTQTCTRGKCRPTVWILRSCRAWWAVGRWHRLHFVWVGGGHFRLQVRSGRDCGRGRCRLIGAHPHVSHAAQPNQCLLTCASLSRGPGTRQVRGLILVCGHKMGWLILCLLFGHILWLLQALYVFIKTADLRRVADSYQLTAVIIRVKAKNTGYAWLFIVLA